jgi:chorismate mutase
MSEKTDQILKPYREKIDSLDEVLVALLVDREKIIREVATIKRENNIPAVIQSRVDSVRENAVSIAIQKGGDADYMREIYTKLIHLSCEIEENT